ncbi:formylglycine-generating enzyme family protein [uncultured Draconibacterium sp.]|uniref:formylglycine-generating enzyme family protein n=1 Tax=uncultured Draconibacterium sp. TaxID=1573823 RepID=UPI0032615424
MYQKLLIILYLPILLLSSCMSEKKPKPVIAVQDNSCCQPDVTSRFMVVSDTTIIKPQPAGTEGMIFIKGGTFNMGADNNQARADEYPKHPVKVHSFWIDEHEVTNAQFNLFVEETGYITVAEKNVDWNILKKQLPPGTPKPHDSLLVAGSMVFTPPTGAVPLNDYSQWWKWTTGACWKHPSGPGSSIEGLENHPVVHICYNDALAYCKWAGKRLPTEAEWEYAARGGLENNIYPWGDEHIESGYPKANSWQGSFPNLNTQKDGFYTTAPVKTYAANGYGLYDMGGNVWEWTADWYDKDYYSTLPANKVTTNPKGPKKSDGGDNAFEDRKTIRGGSFLCNDSYCSSYRVAARMPGEIYTGMSHTGFRCVKDVQEEP